MTLRVRIENLAVGGAGVARHDGLVVFVPDTAPGELVEAELVRSKSNFAEARLVKVLEPGAGRRTPPCSYAGECGGCNWQHLDEAVQREQKQIIVRDTLKKFLPDLEIPLEPLVASPKSLRYRNRVQPLRRGGRLGYRKRRSHDFLPVDDCLIAEEPLGPFFRSPADGPDDTRVELRLHEDGRAELHEGTGEFGFSFSQVNRFQNEDLIRAVLDWTAGESPADIWDLYSGSGNFTFPLASAFPNARVTSVELDAALVATARAKAKSSKMSFFVSDVSAWLRRRSPPEGSLVVLDPPRAGAGLEVMNALAASPATNLIYIACHPVSLARDLAALLQGKMRFRWKLVRVQAFEMFPQTDHLETIAQLRVDSP